MMNNLVQHKNESNLFTQVPGRELSPLTGEHTICELSPLVGHKLATYELSPLAGRGLATCEFSPPAGHKLATCEFSTLEGCVLATCELSHLSSRELSPPAVVSSLLASSHL